MTEEAKLCKDLKSESILNRQYERYLKTILVVLDLFVLNLILTLGEILIVEDISDAARYSYNKYLILTNAAWLAGSIIGGVYTRTVILNFTLLTKRTVQLYIVWTIVVLSYLYFSRDLILSRFYIGYSIANFGLGLLANRFLFLAINRYLRKYKKIIKRVIILGLNDTAQKLTRYFEDDGANMQMVGYIENDDRVTQLTHYPVLAGLSETVPVAKNMAIEEIYSTISPEEDRQIYELMQQSEKECIRFKIVPDLTVFFKRDFHIDFLGDLPVLSLRNEPLDDVGNRFKKRFFDLVVSIPVTLFVLSWLLPLIGLLIFLESGWPVFFRQLRTGKNLKPFNCWKLRSMKVNSEAHRLQATRGDARITRIGRFIRKTSLDEFPQFFNVLLGNMSLVGPRPHMLQHTSDYSRVVDEYPIRQFVKPGITGWAQINGYRGEITNAEQIQMRVNHDLWYLEHWTLWLDIQILFLTVYKILKVDKNAF